MDDVLGWGEQSAQTLFSGGGYGYYASAYVEGQQFLGYPMLAMLQQRSEYRVVTEAQAEDMTREWIRFEAGPKASEDKSKKIQELEDEIERLCMKEVVQSSLENDGFQGRGQVFVDTGVPLDSNAVASEELRTSIGSGRDAVTKEKIKQGDVKALTAIEPMWVYPNRYDATNPLRRDWYRPATWWVMGTEVARSRLITFVGRPVPDLLKPAYSFGGLSMTQMIKPYVDFWLRDRTSASDLLNNFSIVVLATLLDVAGMKGAEDLWDRIETFNALRDSQGTAVINKMTEDIKNVSAPLGGVHELVAQAQEHMAQPARMPIVKVLGSQPAGLNADSEGIIRMYYDTLKGRQERVLRPVMTPLIDLAQMNIWGEVDQDIIWVFNSLWQLDEAGKGAVQLTKAQIVETDIASGAIDPEEGRRARVEDPESPYQGMNLDPNKVAPGEVEEEEQLEGGGGGKGPIDPKDQGSLAERFSRSIGEQGANFGGAETGGFRQAANDGLAYDKSGEFREADHPRDDDGKFTEGVSSSRTSTKTSHLVSLPRDQWPAHVKKLRVPPAWTDVRVSTDPRAALQATGRDSKGRPQYVYSVKFRQSRSAQKFRKVKSLDTKYDAVVQRNDRYMRARDPVVREHALVASLVMEMGLRPGSERDTGAEEQAYGATTLTADHVVKTKDGVKLQFVGKKGVRIDLPVPNEELAEQLVRLSERGGQLFPDVTARSLRKYFGKIAGANTKDFRTLLGTKLAGDLLAKEPVPRTKSEYKRAVRRIAEGVSAKLGNTPTVALQSYISPVVFAPWREAVGLE
ncbi:MAG: DUF1073 domain-containing protein [Elusimicrobia bacterium]|nr:DUF1073 domain-containing protein [Elusimicrobiota bacterium]